MSEDKGKDKADNEGGEEKDEVGGVKDRLRDEFDEAAGAKKGEKKPEGGDKNPDGVKDRVKDEFDKATGGKKGKDRKNEDEKDS